MVSGRRDPCLKTYLRISIGIPLLLQCKQGSLYGERKAGTQRLTR